MDDLTANPWPTMECAYDLGTPGDSTPFQRVTRAKGKPMITSFVKSGAVAAALAGGMLFFGAQTRIGSARAGAKDPAPTVDGAPPAATPDETVRVARRWLRGRPAGIQQVRGGQSAGFGL